MKIFQVLFLTLFLYHSALASLPQPDDLNFFEEISEKRDVSPQLTDKRGVSIIYYHLKYGDETLAQHLLSKSDNLSYTNFWTVFQQAVVSGNLNVLDILTSEKYRSFIEQDHGNRLSFQLLIAIANKKYSALRYLLKKKADPLKESQIFSNPDYDFKVTSKIADYYMENWGDALQFAVICGDQFAIRILEKAGVNVKKYLSAPFQGHLMHFSVLSGDYKTIATVKSWGYSSSQLDMHGNGLAAFVVENDLDFERFPILDYLKVNMCQKTLSGFTAADLARKKYKEPKKIRYYSSYLDKC